MPALLGNGTTASVTWVDRATLEPIAGRSRVYVGLFDIPHAFSPGRSVLALGSGRRQGLAIVDLRGMDKVVSGRVGGVSALTWLSPRLLLTVESSLPGRSLHATVLNVTGSGTRLAGRYQLPSGQTLFGFADAGGAAVLVLGPEDRLGPATLAVVKREGVTTAELGQIEAGVVPFDPASAQPTVRYQHPGLAVDGAGGRAFVVGAEGLVAELDLETLAVVYHRLAGSPSAPARRADGGGDVTVEGSWRQAAWIGPDRLALAGYDEFVEEVDGTAIQHNVPAGLQLIDTTTWTATTLDERAERLTWTGAFLAAVSWQPGRLAVYDRNGNVRFGRAMRADGVQLSRRHAYLTLGNEYRQHRVRILSLDSGRVQRTVPVDGWFYPLNRASAQRCWC
jgi:hypothetical protein